MQQRIFFLAALLLLSPLACLSQVSGNAAAKAQPQPAVLSTEFHAGETVSYAFVANLSLSSRSNPRLNLQDNSVPAFERSYRASGEMVAAFTPGDAGAALHAQLRFRGIAISDWRGNGASGTAEELAAHLRGLESEVIPVRFDASGGITSLGKVHAEAGNPRNFDLDVIRLKLLAVSILDDDGDRQARSPGTQWDKVRPAPKYLQVDEPSVKTSDQIHVRYLRNLDLAGRAQALLTVSGESTGQAPMKPEFEAALKKSGATGKMQLSGAGGSLSLFDPAAHRPSYLRFRGQGRVRVVLRSTDTDAEVRVPVWVFEVRFNEEGTIRLLSGDAAFDSQLVVLQPALEAEVPVSAQEPASALQPRP